MYRQVEFVHGAPTHRLIDGISRISHAHRVAQRIGFAKEHIEKHLVERGYRDEETTSLEEDASDTDMSKKGGEDLI